MIRESSPRMQMHFAYLKMIVEGQARDNAGNLPDDADKAIAAGIILALKEAFERRGSLDEAFAMDVCKRFYGDRWPHPLKK